MIRNMYLLIVLTIVVGACTKKQETLTMDMSDSAVESGKAEDLLKNKGIGPFKKVTLAAELDVAMANRGKKIFESKCFACHKFNEKVVGPSLSGVTKRRSPEWIMNLIVNTNEMVEKDPIVKSMIAEYMTKMTFQDITKIETRELLEYFRQKDGVK
jgi:mono/diheme cytochrome c family protein